MLPYKGEETVGIPRVENNALSKLLIYKDNILHVLLKLACPKYITQQITTKHKKESQFQLYLLVYTITNALTNHMGRILTRTSFTECT